MTRQSSHTALLWIVAVGFFMQALDTTIVNTALPSIARDLFAAPLAMQSIVVAYTLTMALLTPASGWLADRFGTRRVYFASIALFVIGSLACSSAHTLNQLVMARVLRHRRLDAAADRPPRPAHRDRQSLRLRTRDDFGRRSDRPDARRLVRRIVLVALDLPDQRADRNVPIGAAGLYAVRRFLPHDPLDSRAPFDFVGCGLLSL